MPSVRYIAWGDCGFSPGSVDGGCSPPMPRFTKASACEWTLTRRRCRATPRRGLRPTTRTSPGRTGEPAPRPSHLDHDIAHLLSGLHEPVRLDDLLQGIAAVEHRTEPAAGDELLQVPDPLGV